MAFVVTFLAGGSTLLGMIPILFSIKNKERLIAFSLAFSSGVMLTVSIIDLIPESVHYLTVMNKSFPSFLLSFLFIVIGIFLSHFIDKEIDEEQKYTNHLYKIGLISMLAIIMHNIPEGIATFLSYQANNSLGITLAIAIALHNIPEGITIAIPIYYSTHSKKLAFLYTLISALSEPLGAFLASLFLGRFMTPTIMGLLLSIIAGIMIHISCYLLLPSAKRYYRSRTVFKGFSLGSFIMFLCIRFLH